MSEIHTQQRRAVRAGVLRRAQQRAVATECDDELRTAGGLQVVRDDCRIGTPEAVGLALEGSYDDTGRGQQIAELLRRVEGTRPLDVYDEQNGPVTRRSHCGPASIAAARAAGSSGSAP